MISYSVMISWWAMGKLVSKAILERVLDGLWVGVFKLAAGGETAAGVSVPIIRVTFAEQVWNIISSTRTTCLHRPYILFELVSS